MGTADAASTTDDRVVHVVLAEKSLSRGGRLAAIVLALAVLALAGLGSTWAGTPPVITEPAAVLAAGSAVTALPVGCDGPTTHLAWDSTTYSTVELSVVGDRVATPGDRVGCTVDVTNTGPSAAVMTVAFAPEVLKVGASNPELAEGLYFFWNAAGVSGTERVDTVAGGDGVVVEVQVARGEVVPVEVGVTMPVEVTDYERDGQDSTQLSFGVTVRLSEPTDPSPPVTTRPSTSLSTPTGASSSSTASDLGQAGSGQAGPASRGATARVRASGLRLPRTGAEIAGVAAVAGGLVLAGTVIWIVAHRRRERRDPCAGETR